MTRLDGRRAYRRAIAKNRDGDLAGAEEDYRICVALGPPQLKSAASINLGRMRVTAGDLDEARELFESVVRVSKDALMREKASYNLGIVFLRQGELEASEFAFRWVLGSYDKRLLLQSILRLVTILSQAGRSEEATQLLGEGMELEQARHAPVSVVELARLAVGLGQATSARALLADVLRHADGEPAALAHLLLARMFIGEGDHAAAMLESRQVLDSPIVVLHGDAHLVSGAALLRAGDVAGALHAWRTAAESNDPRIRHIALANAGEELIRRHDDVEGARPLLEEVEWRG